ncbi:single-stranded DNA-binding protein [Deinococcus sp. HMF7620]|uniref:Single-stranded DNA-binding protein n=1 Tax=Deinococcus arboris TaxID=2682977 RepID=A0A7C9M9B5_9DEIO|nr:MULTISPECIES: single-stranded DNA-binding protein [Deinococcus]MBZ9752207.1 single-stranded DNA-binding protein [Deinococcus betulae]MVN87539.1 single-stranded DNA-binding protein [Deinococcus arboris]
MVGLNRVTLAGRLTQDVEIHETPGGLTILRGTIHGQEDLFTEAGPRTVEWYHRFELAGGAAKYAAQRACGAGTAVMLDGMLDYQEWPTAEGIRRALRVKGLQLSVLDVTPDGPFGMNQVMVAGHLGRNAQMRGQGEPVTELRLGVSDRFTNRQGQAQSQTHWVNVTLWRQLARRFQHLQKGAGVVVTGKLVNASWEGSSGQRQTETKVEAQRVMPLAANRQNAVASSEGNLARVS